MDLFTGDLLQDFESVFPSLIKDLTELDGSEEMQWTNEWLGKVIKENVPNGKKGRDDGVCDLQGTFESCAYHRKDHEENTRLAKIIGWCMEFAGFENQNQQLVELAGEILMRIGHLFQVQDDFLDIYGDVSETKKVGRDIQDGKCTWFLVNALHSADINQLEILKEEIGQPDKGKVDLVKDVYNQLDLKGLYLFISKGSKTQNLPCNSTLAFYKAK